MANALRIFKELDVKRKAYLKPGHSVSKHIVYIANSPAYEMPVQDVPEYIGQSVDDVIKKIADQKINFSVISPRKIPQVCMYVVYKSLKKRSTELIYICFHEFFVFSLNFKTLDFILVDSNV